MTFPLKIEEVEKIPIIINGLDIVVGWIENEPIPERGADFKSASISYERTLKMGQLYHRLLKRGYELAADKEYPELKRYNGLADERINEFKRKYQNAKRNLKRLENRKD